MVVNARHDYKVVSVSNDFGYSLFVRATSREAAGRPGKPATSDAHDRLPGARYRVLAACHLPQRLGPATDRVIPSAGARLAEQAHRRMQGAVLAPCHPAPVGWLIDQHPGWDAQRAAVLPTVTILSRSAIAAGGFAGLGQIDSKEIVPTAPHRHDDGMAVSAWHTT
jgi:hypothetical protein